MKTTTQNNPYTVRCAVPISDAALQKFALDVSNALTRAGALAEAAGTVVQGDSVQGKTSSWAMALYDEVTGVISFLPGVRFVPVGANDVNIGFELDVSPKVGVGTVSGTSQGYMANFGTVGGSKLAAGMSANNETTAIPRLDIGFKPTRGATLEMYGSDGGTANTRAGQIRATLGPGGQFMVIRYVATSNTWEYIGGFGSGGELICGWRNGHFPSATEAPAALNVYARPTGAGATTAAPVATIADDGKLKLMNGSSSVTVSPAGVTGAITLTLQQKTFVGDSAPSWVFCAAT